jgi:hypothetical protein
MVNDKTKNIQKTINAAYIASTSTNNINSLDGKSNDLGKSDDLVNKIIISTNLNTPSETIITNEKQGNSNECNDNINNWTKLFTDYCDCEKICTDNLNVIGEIKNNLKKLLGNQKKDDIIFYKAIIENSYYYLSNCLKIRKIKFLKDINYIWSIIDTQKQIDEINKHNFTTLMKDYNKMVDDINTSKKNNTVLTWVKNDTVENLHDLEKDIYEILEYHFKLIKSLSEIIELEKLFYHGG